MSDHTSPFHIPVLLEATAASLTPRPGETVVDCTAGLGGHAARLAPLVAPGGAVILNDFDPANLRTAEAAVRGAAPGVEVVAVQGNFVDIPRRLREAGRRADVLLADLGFSSNQMQEASRGFSFMRDGPLDMRLDPTSGRSAAALISALPEGELASIIHRYGEEPRARAIARKLVAARESGPIDTTFRLVALLREVFGPRHPTTRIDPVTRTFQAFRIAVNDEISNLESLLESIRRSAEAIPTGSSAAWLSAGARVGIIAFHSLEDRLVKQHFRELTARGLADAITRRPIVADEVEVASNPRSRSAKLRVIALADAT